MSDEGPNQGELFNVEGWHERQPINCRILSRSFLMACRSQIAYEIEKFDQRLPELEARIAAKGSVPKAVEDSKQRVTFELTVNSDVKDSSPPQTVYSASTAPFRPTPWEGAPAIAPTPVNMLPAHWLAMRFPQGGIVFDISSQDPELLHGLSVHPFDVQFFQAGEGQAIPTMSHASERHRPDPASFGQWFLESGGKSMPAVLAFLLGPETGATDITLLRFRLSSHHVLVVCPGSSCVQPLLSAWDGTAYQMGEYLLLCDPGPGFLRPAKAGPNKIPDDTWPKISVITVSFNQATYLEECLLSVLDQGYPNLEYIVIDACSTDGSQDILRRYEGRLDTLVIEPDDGQSDGLTKGFSHATGEILTWVNSDDLLAPDALRHAALAFLTQDCDLVAGGCDRVTENTEDIIARHHSALPLGKVVDLGLHHNLMWHDAWEKGDYFFQPEVFFSAEIWRRSGAYLKPHLYWAMDYELWIRMAMAGARVAHIPETLALSRMHDEQKTTQEALYLYQLKNILLEYDDLFQELEKFALELPEGDFIYDRPTPGHTPAAPAAPSTLTGRILGLRDPNRLAAALKRRLKPSTVNLMRRLWRLRHPHHAARALDRRLPSFARSMGRSVLRRVKYSRRGYRVVSAVRLSELTTRSNMLSEIIDKANADARMLEYTQNEMAQLQSHTADLKAAMEAKESIISEYVSSVQTLQNSLMEQDERYKKVLQEQIGSYETALKDQKESYEGTLAKQQSDFQSTLAQQQKDLSEASEKALAGVRGELTKNLEEASEREGKLSRDLEAEKSAVRQLSDEAASALAQIFFDRASDPKTLVAAKELLLQGLSAKDAVATLINRQSHLIHTHHFRAARRLITPDVEFPVVGELEKVVGELTIVDIGSEIIAEGDIYGPLAEHWTCKIIGFDPFMGEEFEPAAEESGTGEPATSPERPYKVETLPNFVGDGGNATFHINRFGPTSSLKETNHDLADRFGLLGEALKTAQTLEVETHLLDNLLDSRGEQPEFYDFLKVDVQGSTFDVLKGAKGTLKKTLVCQLEAEFSELYLGERLFPEIHDAMSKAGFELVDLCNLGHERYGLFDAVPQYNFHASKLLWADCIYMKKTEKILKKNSAALLRMAVIFHHIYRKYDLAAALIGEYDKRKSSTLLDLYFKAF